MIMNSRGQIHTMTHTFNKVEARPPALGQLVQKLIAERIFVLFYHNF